MNDARAPAARAAGRERLFSAHTIVLFVLGAVISYLAIAGWFRPFQFTVFAGDDLRLADFVQRDPAALWRPEVKFRPVNSFVTTGLVQASNFEYRRLAGFTVAIHTANALLFFLLLYRALRLPVVFAFGLTVVAMLNRFTTYLYMQEQAIMEGTAIFILLSLFWASLRYAEAPGRWQAAFLAGLFALLVHTHERYLVLALPLGLLGFFSWRQAPGAALILSGGSAAAVALNVGIKTFLLRTPVLIGTTTQPIAFDFGQIGHFFLAGLATIFGINKGPSHLAIADFLESPLWLQALSVLLVIASCLLLASAFATGKMRQRLGWLLFGLASMLALVLAASVTFRQEYRWVYPAFLVLLILFARGLPRSGGRARAAGWLLAFLILGGLGRECYLAQHYPRFYAYHAYEIANDFHRVVAADRQLAARQRIIVREPVPVYSWIFIDQTFARFYKLPPIDFEGEAVDIEAGAPPPLLLGFRSKERRFDLLPTPDAVADTAPGSIEALVARSLELEPREELSTPTKTLLFQARKDGIDVVAAVSPLEISVPVPPGAERLHIKFTHFYALGDGATLFIVASGAEGEVTLLQRNVPPLPADDRPVWRTYQFALPAQVSEVRLKIVSEGDPAADWIAFRDFSFH